MRTSALLVGAAAVVLGGCSTNSTYAYKDLNNEGTHTLCRELATHPDQAYRAEVAKHLVKRGATVEKCNRLIAADNSIAASIAVAGAAVAVGAAANSGGGYYPSSPAYGVAWDQFYNEYGQVMWRCRDRSNGRFVYDTYCGGLPMVDSTWPGWRA